MRRLFFILLMFLFYGCVPNMAPTKNVLKSLKMPGTEIEWFSVSSAYADVPDYITINSGKHTDTICRSNNIADLKDVGNEKKSELRMTAVLIYRPSLLVDQAKNIPAPIAPAYELMQ